MTTGKAIIFTLGMVTDVELHAASEVSGPLHVAWAKERLDGGALGFNLKREKGDGWLLNAINNKGSVKLDSTDVIQLGVFLECDDSTQISKALKLKALMQHDAVAGPAPKEPEKPVDYTDRPGWGSF